MTTQPMLLDHIYVLIYAVVYPTVGYFTYQRVLKLIAAGTAPPRNGLYVSTIAGHWLVMLLGVVLWAGLDRSWSTMGFSFEPDWLFGLGAVLALAGIALLARQVWKIKSATPDDIGALYKQFEPVKPILPHTRSELHMFYRVSVTAGIVEEVLWRGALIWYLSNYLPIWAAATISAVGFGLAHSYQGMAQVPRVIAVGAVFTVLYLITGSVWVPIVLHIFVDVLQGRLAHDVLKHPSIEQPQTTVIPGLNRDP